MKGGKGKAPGDYEVGYGKPPRHTQFPPDKSGNPNGRPQGALGKHRQLVKAMDQPTRAMFMAEMQRAVTVMSDGKTIKMPIIQAVTRAMAKTAAAGGQQAQRTAILLQLELEKEAAAENARLLAEIREYKATAGPIFAECRARGIPEPKLFPHPDDIFIDEQTQRAEIRGPRTLEQRAHLDKILAERGGYQRGVSGLQAEAVVNPRDWTLPILATMAQERFDLINSLLPERYRKKLENRMTAAQIEAARKKADNGLEARRRRARRTGDARARGSRERNSGGV